MTRNNIPWEILFALQYKYFFGQQLLEFGSKSVPSLQHKTTSQLYFNFWLAALKA